MAIESRFSGRHDRNIVTALHWKTIHFALRLSGKFDLDAGIFGCKLVTIWEAFFKIVLDVRQSGAEVDVIPLWVMNAESLSSGLTKQLTIELHVYGCHSYEQENAFDVICRNSWCDFLHFFVASRVLFDVLGTSLGKVTTQHFVPMISSIYCTTWRMIK